MATRFLSFAFFFCLVHALGWSQDADWDEAKWNLNQLCQETYNATPFTGVKLTTYEGTKYLVSAGVASVTKGQNLAALSRIAEMRARRSVLLYLENPRVSSETIFGTSMITENGKSELVETFEDVITEQSQGFVSGLEVLTAFDDKKNESYVVFLISPLEQ